uniref:EF-hand domain-containing protein n=1 Tax=Chromera velia CCMP2878 TaxID=1169474 RepID=A0A0G4H9U8_9ALVE|eukprot:Cvel_901.t1-p1 / transcript=Cvel_901.t1 / gene=Cvel_901 / organism=Chromera_velia_CCMP2878 / gene_product=hypothetical protein / transcript_product=hypothetical protein / location=Cvel_scaffold28:123052-127030(+) / protein_length=176 / sequence_SO=supercontig / SO=protein_coding / is_pseudo=false
MPHTPPTFATQVDFPLLFKFLFPPSLEYPESTGRLDLFALYGPLDTEGQLRAGPQGFHVVQHYEIKAEGIRRLFNSTPRDNDGYMQFEDLQRVILADLRQRMLTLIDGGEITTPPPPPIPYQSEPARILDKGKTDDRWDRYCALRGQKKGTWVKTAKDFTKENGGPNIRMAAGLEI